MTTINLTEDTANCISTNIVKETTSNLDNCTIEVPFDFTITIGDELNLYDKDSTLLFKGLVQNIKIGGKKEIIAYDYGVQLMDININDIYSSQTPEYIIEDIVTNNTDLTYVSTIVTGTAITTYVVKDKKGWDVISELAELLNASFRVDKNKNFYLELIEEDSSTETITSENAVIDGDWDQDADQLVNKVIIIGDKQLFEKTESFNGTGAEDTFTLDEFPVDINVTVGGVEQTGFVAGVTTTADYKIDKATKDVIFESGSIPGSGTNNVVIRYTFSIDIKLTSQDSTSIASYGGPNLIPKEKKIVKPYITSFQEAYKFANFYLGIYAQPLLTATWIINDYTKFEDFVPNQKISVTDSIRNITDTFIIKKVEREFPGQLKVDIGWQEDDILDWSKEVQYRIKQLEERDDNSTILQEYGFIENKVQLQVTTTVERELYRDLPDDYMYWGDENDTPVYANIGDGTARPWKDATEIPAATEFFITDKNEWDIPTNEIPGLTRWYKLDGDVTDSSDNSADASVLIATSGAEAYDTGLQFDEAFDFVGTGTPKKNEGAYISMPADVDADSQNHSLSFWYKSSSSYFQMLFIQTLNSSSGNIEFDVSNNQIDFESTTNNAFSANLPTGINIDDGEWHHYCLVFSSTDTKLYTDGVVTGTTSANSDVLGYFRYRIIGGYGSTSFTYGEMPTGVMADVRIFDEKQLDVSEVEDLYNNGNGLTFQYSSWRPIR